MTTLQTSDGGTTEWHKQGAANLSAPHAHCRRADSPSEPEDLGLRNSLHAANSRVTLLVALQVDGAAIKRGQHFLSPHARANSLAV